MTLEQLERSRRFDELWNQDNLLAPHVDFLHVIGQPLSDEFKFAREKHGPGNTVQNPDMPNWRKLAILVEEVGEVAEAMQDDKGKGLARELLQVAAVALMWYDSVR